MNKGLKLPGKSADDILNSDEFKNLGPEDMLKQSVENGFKEGVELALDRGAYVHTNNDFALRWAVHNSHEYVIKLLLDKGADIHADNDYALRWAAVKGYKDIVDLLQNWIKEH